MVSGRGIAITLAAQVAIILLVSLAVVSPAPAQTLDRIQATKTLRIGFIDDQAPFASSENGNTPVGYAIEVCGAVAGEVGRRIPGVKAEYIRTTIADAFAD